MKHRHYWLLALLSILTLMTTQVIAGETMTSGHIEVGISGMDTDDNPARVNEYVNTRSENGLSFTPNISLEAINDNSSFSLGADILGPRDQELNLEFDAQRIFKFNLDHSVMEHWKDHETLDQMGATMRGDTGGSQPTVSTDKIFADLAELGVTSVGGVTLNYDAAEAYNQELSNDYIVTRRETKARTELTLPSLPNLTFHAGMRIETRQGLEQAIGMTKCDGCHVSAVGKDIDERTEDFTMGVTGKFGPLTVEYEYQNRTFKEDGATPVRYYEDAGNPSAGDQLLYENGDFEFNRTPDSDKDSHFLKARYDFSSATSLSASYTKADIESNKSEPASEDSYSLANGDTLKTEFEAFGGKLATKIGDWRLSLKANTYSIDADGNTVELKDDVTTRDDNDLLSFSLDQEWTTAEERDVTEFGIDAVYRLAQGTTLRLGYDYEKQDREETELGETETNTFKIALKSRLNQAWSGRLSYQYQNIDDPFHGEDITGIAQGIGTTDPAYPGLEWLETFDYVGIENNSDAFVWYWNSVYPNRTMDATNQPDTVHEVKVNSTWAPAANMAATLFARIRYEENDDVSYEQTSYVPGASFWYAPNNKMNLTMAYTFNKQKTENNMCVGWYHG